MILYFADAMCAVVSEQLKHSTPVMYAELVSYWVRGFNSHYCWLYGAVNFNAWGPELQVFYDSTIYEPRKARSYN